MPHRGISSPCYGPSGRRGDANREPDRPQTCRVLSFSGSCRLPLSESEGAHRRSSPRYAARGACGPTERQSLH